MNGRLPLLVLIVSSTFLSLPRSADAQGTETDVAAQFFEAGAAAAKRGEFRVCAEAFTEAHKRAPNGATIYNAGLCWENAKDLPRAANDYKQALKLDNLTGAQENQTKKRYQELRRKLGEIEIAEPEGATTTLGPIAQGKIPFTTFVTPGSYEVRVESMDGEVVSKTVEAEAGQHVVLKLEFPNSDRDEPGSKRRDDDVSGPPVPPESTNYQATAGWVVVGASVLAGGIAGGFYLSALSARNDYEGLSAKDQDDPTIGQPLKDKAYSRVKVARALGIGAGIGAAVGVTLILTAPRTKSQPGAALRIHPRGASAIFTF